MASPNKNTYYLCKNLKGTSQNNYDLPKDSCRNWLEHWRKENPYSKRSKCSVSRFSCQGVRTGNRTVAAGAHVLLYDDRRLNKNKWHIIPVCAACNHYTNTAEFWVTQQITPVLVTANH